jgi:bifunctional non-homologous end joining protein LigD
VVSKGVKGLDDVLKSAPRARMMKGLRPMLATLTDKPFDSDEWIFEVKWDGYRALSYVDKGKPDIRSRNDKIFTDKYYPIAKALNEIKTPCILDGEIVVVNEKGISDFGALQNWRSEADGDLLYYVFDILWMDGRDLRGLPLEKRRSLLQNILPAGDIIRLSESFPVSGIEFFDTAKKMGLEGIIAKKKESAYISADRSKEWLKIKAANRQEMVIGGYTINDESSKIFSAILVGVYENTRLIYTGKVGTGFDDKTQKEMLKLFKPLLTKTCPFTEVPDVNKPSRFRPNPPHASVFWLKPSLVCEVSFIEMTSDGIMRHPSFQGMRIDKKSKEVKLETAKPSAEKNIPDPVKAVKVKLKPASKDSAKTLLNPTEETQVKKVNGKELKFTNLSKIYWPAEKITKRDMINYYYAMAPYILPYLKDRPQSMNRHPDGIMGESFYFKDITGKAPEWLARYKYHSDADDRDRHYLVAKDMASLLYMASLGCIEMNPWSSTVQKENYPDWCMIDLDPAKTTFEQVIEAALVTKDILDSMHIPSYPKTSGSTGMHIYIPMGAKYTYEQSKEFARVIARMVHKELPEFTSIERMVKNRGNKMYIDFLQNRPQATISAPYSLRPKPGATVSMPLQWDEVKKGLKMTDFNIFNAYERVQKMGDIFRPVLGKGINLEKALKAIDKNELSEKEK